MTTITYHTWKKRQQVARLILLFALALAILPTIAFGSNKEATTPQAVTYPPAVISFSLPTAPPFDKQ